MKKRTVKSILVFALVIVLVVAGAQVVLAAGGSGPSTRASFWEATLTPTPTGLAAWTGRTWNPGLNNRPAGTNHASQDFFKNLLDFFNRGNSNYRPITPTPTSIPTATPTATPIPQPVCTQLSNDTAHHVVVSCLRGVTADIHAPSGATAYIASLSDTTTLPNPPNVNFLGDAVTLVVNDSNGVSIAYVPGEICFNDPSMTGDVFMWSTANSEWMYIPTFYFSGMDCSWFWTPGIYTRN